MTVAYLDLDLDPAVLDRASLAAGMALEKHQRYRAGGGAWPYAELHATLTRRLAAPRLDPPIHAVVLDDTGDRARTCALIASVPERVWLELRSPRGAVAPPWPDAERLLSGARELIAHRLPPSISAAEIAARLAGPGRDALYLIGDPHRSLATPDRGVSDDFGWIVAWVRAARWVLTSHSAWPDWAPSCIYTEHDPRALPGLAGVTWITSPRDPAARALAGSDAPRFAAVADPLQLRRAERIDLSDTDVVSLAGAPGAADLSVASPANAPGGDDTDDVSLANAPGADEHGTVASRAGDAEPAAVSLANASGADDTAAVSLANAPGADDTDDVSLANAPGADDTAAVSLANAPGADEHGTVASRAGDAEPAAVSLANAPGADDTDDVSLANAPGADEHGSVPSFAGDAEPAASVRELSVARCPLVHLDELAAIRSLEVVDLSGVPLRSLAPLAALPRLRTLRLDLRPRGGWAELAALPALRCLDLDGILALDPAELAAHLAVPALRIRRGDRHPPWPVVALAAARGLEALAVNAADTDLTGLAALPELRALALRSGLVAPRETLAGLDRLTGLAVDLRSLAELPSLPALRRLATAVPELAGLAALPALEHLELRYAGEAAHAPDALAPLVDQAALRSLVLRDFDALPYDVLARLRLSALTVSGTPLDLASLARLPDLVHLDTADRTLDLAALAPHPALASLILRGIEHLEHPEALLGQPALQRVVTRAAILPEPLVDALAARGVTVATHPLAAPSGIHADLDH